MIRVQILIPWIGSGASKDPHRPKLGDDYQLIRYQDLTNQPAVNITPNPNLFLAQVDVTEEVFAQIQTDPTYLVLTSEAL